MAQEDLEGQLSTLKEKMKEEMKALADIGGYAYVDEKWSNEYDKHERRLYELAEAVRLLEESEKKQEVQKGLEEMAQERNEGYHEFSEEEKAAYAEKKREEVNELTARVEQGVKEVLNSEQYKEYLKTVAQFHNYSFRNSLLIYMANPDATYVAGSSKWHQLGRYPSEGERGIRIFAPVKYETEVNVKIVDKKTGLFVKDSNGNYLVDTKKIERVGYKAVSVFDISQTSGKPLAVAPKPQMLTGEVKDYEKAVAAVHSISPCPIHFSDMKNIRGNGYYDLETKEIFVRAGLSEEQTIKTMLHEVAHARMHNYDLSRPEDNPVKGVGTREVQAESVAFVVATRFGIDASEYTFPYVAGWGSADMKELQASFNDIQKTSGAMIYRIDKAMEKDIGELQKDVQKVQNREPVKDTSKEKAAPSRVGTKNIQQPKQTKTKTRTKSKDIER